ncbi:MAG: tetratricopeptide repeat protein [Acidobacteriota bacterium]|nr:tetratricopeptide repeat protein [Acidobacteriota bacterium]
MDDLLRPLLMMFYAPARGMGEVRDRASLGRAALLALTAQAAHVLYMQWPQVAASLSGLSVFAVFGAVISAASALMPVALVFVPLVILAANLFERRASFGLALKQEYAGVASVVFYAWAAACLVAIPLAVIVRATGFEADAMNSMRAAQGITAARAATPEDLPLMWAALLKGLGMIAVSPFFLFTLWAVVGVRQVFRFSWLRAIIIVSASGVVSLPLAGLLLVVFGPLLSSPFILLMLFLIFRSYMTEAARAQRARASFKQNLEAATLNPADASAHYNLGLIHLQRKELDEARRRFEQTIEVDAEEVDAHYQLGRIARMENRLSDAVQHFEQVVARDPAHAQHEVWREIGATYLDAGQSADAHDALERFLEHRQTDPEALYLAGRALAGMGRVREAAQSMQACIEAVKTAPAYKYRADKRWLNEAQQFLRSQA